MPKLRPPVPLGLVLLLLSFEPVCTNIVFDEVGTLAGAVSYAHVAINIDFTSVATSISQLYTTLDSYDESVATGLQNSAASNQRQNLNRTHLQLAQNRRNRLGQVQGKFVNIQRILQGPPRKQRDVSKFIGTLDILKKTTDVIRIGDSFVNALGIRTNLASILNQGNLVSFLGSFNPKQLKTIKEDFKGLISLFTSHDQQLQANSQTQKDLLQQSAVTSDANLLLQHYSDFETAINSIENGLSQILDAVQQAQHQRLSIDLLDAEQLAYLFSRLDETAKRTDTELIISSPAHLFQLETTLLFDGHDAALILHIPMVPTNSLLTLRKLRPFPIPVTSQHALMPHETPELLAFSNDHPPKWNLIYQYSLLSCSRINSIYVCPGNGILRDDSLTHCLGALYEQRTDLIIDLCDLDVVPERELALQLDGDRFLVYALRTITGSISCPKVKIEHRPIQKGISVQRIPPGCSLRLDHTTVYSHFNLRLEDHVKYLEWQKTTIEQFGLTESDINATKEDLPTSRHDLLPLSEIIEHKKRWYKRHPFMTMAIIAFAGSLTFTAVGICILIAAYRYITRNQHQSDSSLSALEERFEKLKNFTRSKLDNADRIQVRLPTPPSDLIQDLSHRIQEAVHQ